MPRNECPSYTTSKFALVGLSETLRAEYSRHGIGVTALCPGLVDTNLVDEHALGGREDGEGQREGGDRPKKQTLA